MTMSRVLSIRTLKTMAKNKQYSDDDGRTVADMSGIEKAPLIIPKPFGRHDDIEVGEEQSDAQPENQLNLSKEERRSFIFGTVSAAIVIGLIFAAVFAAVILAIIFFGK